MEQMVVRYTIAPRAAPRHALPWFFMHIDVSTLLIAMTLNMLTCPMKYGNATAIVNMLSVMAMSRVETSICMKNHVRAWRGAARGPIV